MAEAIRRLVGERPVTLMGQSTGGFAVLNIAARCPELARRVVCVSGFTRGRWNGFLGFNQRLLRMGTVGKELFKSIYKLGGANPGLFKLALGIYAKDAQTLFADPKAAQALERSLYNFR
jgi:pimeloyl-ACP methyl ester carboxylesterase